MITTFYLLNERVNRLEQAINPDKIQDYEVLPRRDTNLNFEVMAFLQRNRRNIPAWLSFIRGHFDVGEEFFNTSNSLVVVLRVHDRVFAITKGSGYAAIDKRRIERNFGLKVVLNAINPQSIRTIDTKSLDTKAKQRIELISADSPLYEFGFDLDSDILRVVSGVPSDVNFARRFSGSDSLHLNKEVDFRDLGDVCSTLLEFFEDDAYQDNFSFIDNIVQVSDENLLEELRQRLLQALANREDDNLYLAYPEIAIYENSEVFILEYGHNHGRLPEVSLDTVYSFLADLPGPKNLSDIQFHGLDQAGDRVTKYLSIEEFCVYETVLGEQRYLLSFGQWFEISNGYREQITASLRMIPEINLDFLPAIREGQREDDYCRQVSDASIDIINLDKNNFHLGQQNRVEVCDLLSRDAQFICVKKYNSSSTLSHLFAQGLVSSELLLDDAEYRRFILDECADFALPFDENPLVDRSRITYVFAIAVRADDRLVNRLPFFSQVNLLHNYKRIRRSGFNVAVCRIDVA